MTAPITSNEPTTHGYTTMRDATPSVIKMTGKWDPAAVDPSQLDVCQPAAVKRQVNDLAPLELMALK